MGPFPTNDKEPVMSSDHKIETRLVHDGEHRASFGGAVVTPIFQTAMFETAADEIGYHDIRYVRLSNSPNHRALGEKLASLENAETALVTASGMAAISTAILSTLSSGDHILAQECLYGGTHAFIVRDIERFGMRHDVIDVEDPDSWKSKLRPETRAIYVETMTNPLLQVADLRAIAAFAREHGLVSIIDNTFATPVNFRPIEHGFDLSVHSCTKYLNGHTDLAAGAVIGAREHVDRIKILLDHLGGSLDPHACYLLHRGLKTLALRVRHQGASALELASHLERHPAVARVNHPGLESHPHHARAAELFDGFGGMLSFELTGGAEAAGRFMKNVRIPLNAPSLGGPETLMTFPAKTSHAGVAPEERERLGITEGLIRISVGLENSEDLIADFDRGLA
ncbi:MAG: aminotransferase class I/II-fold pyridoxal phosphate-dependent enzyme [Acidobacteriota bacterium]|nr:aminotransferase class I/II-fold pyridoxal phosphate-dependent enzyme [Acidobacteriota bacterium]